MPAVTAANMQASVAESSNPPPKMLGTGTKGPMALGDPFAAFLATRHPDGEVEPGKMHHRWQPKQLVHKKQSDFVGDVDTNPFASFIAMRPKPAPPPIESTVEQDIRDELLRAKRQLLEVGMRAELMALDPSCPRETAAKLRQIRKARRYLRHPEHTTEALSGSVSDASDNEYQPQEPTSLDDATPPKAVTLGASSSSRCHSSLPDGRALGSSMSMPNLQRSKNAKGMAVDPVSMADVSNTTLLPSQSTGTLLPAIAGACKPVATGEPPQQVTRSEEGHPLLRGWWTARRCWNIHISNKDLTARRKNMALPGGTVVIGNGRIPLFTGTHLLSCGYFYSFKVEALDDAHFPAQECRDLSFGFGVSRHPAHHKSCERPMFAYEIPKTVLVGYGDHVIDSAKWWRSSWDPKDLKEKDVVGVLVPPNGDIVVYVNDVQVLRVPTSLVEDYDHKKPKSGTRRTLFPVIDLHGRVSAVTLLPTGAPPNTPLQTRNPLR